MSGPLLEVARRAVDVARSCGAEEAGAGAYRARHVEVSWRDGRLDRVSEATTRGLGLEVYVDGRYSAVSTSDLRPEALRSFVGAAVEAARRLARDPHRRLPDPELYRGRADVDLELEDPSWASLSSEERRRRAEAAEAGARSAPGASAILSVTAAVGDTFAERAVVHSNGFEGERRGTDFAVSAEVSARDPDGRRPEEWDAASARFLADLPGPEEVGRRAAERALARVGARKPETALLPMAVERRAAGRLVAQLLAPLSAGALQQKRSCLEGMRGEAVGSPRLSLGDDPLVRRGLGSRLFDGEGIAARPFPLFEGGVLRSYYVDAYYGRKLGMAPTTARLSNLSWRLGERGEAALLADMGEGVLATGFLGGNANPTTGDFSLGVKGFRVRGGRLAEPLGEMNVSGNHLDLWKRLAAVGCDPHPWPAMRTPTLLFEGVQIAGR